MKVSSTNVPEVFPFSGPDKNGLRAATMPLLFSADCEIDGVKGKLVFVCRAGMHYNGASNPLEWPIKNYYGDPKKDCCGLGHDLLYAHGGRVIGLDRRLTAGECDDFIRGAMREAGFSRTEAGLTDWAVRHFAHWFHFGEKHDKERMHHVSSITWVPDMTAEEIIEREG